MKNDLLSELIFDTNFIEEVFLSAREKHCLVAIIKKGETYKQVAEDIGISNERVRQIFNEAFFKIQRRIQEITAKAKRHDALLVEKEKVDQELSILKNRFKKQLAARGQMKIDFDIATLTIDDMPLTIRAKNALEKLQVKNANDLRELSVFKLKGLPGIGVKTIHEIVRRAEEIGIKIL